MVISNSNGPVKKTQSMKLSLNEKSHINNNNTLSDKSIALVQQLVGKQFPDYAGFGDVVFMKQNGFDLVNAAKPFIQVLHIGSSHWLHMLQI